MSLRTLLIAMLGGVPAERFRKAEEEAETWFSRWDEESKAHNRLLRKITRQNMILDEEKPEFDEFDKGWNAAIRAMSALDTRVDNPNSHTTTEVLRHG